MLPASIKAAGKSLCSSQASMLFCSAKQSERCRVVSHLTDNYPQKYIFFYYYGIDMHIFLYLWFMKITELKPLFPEECKKNGLLLIAGPCSAESERQVLETAHALKSLGIGIFRAGVWKPRTKPGGFEGIGADALKWMAKAKEETGMLITTEVATPTHLRQALEAGVDAVWVGARTSANPFAVQELANIFAAMSDENRDKVAVMIKNPVNTDLELWIGAIERFYNAGVRRLGAIHRGFSSYGKHVYRNMPEWRIPIELHRRLPEIPIICDPSHIGGQRDLIAPLSDQALRMNFDGLIIESHCNPDYALSDSNQQVTPDTLGEILKSLNLHTDNLSQETLTDLRRQIDEIDDKLMEILAQRMSVSRQIGILKKQQNMPVVQPNRYNSLIENRVERAKDLKLGTDFVTRILEEIHEESVRQQLNI